MKRGKSTGKPTKAEQARMDALVRLGCIACRHDGRFAVPPTIHHICAGYRIGHDATLPLCAWHHLGTCAGNPDEVAKRYGPSLHHHKRAFVARYGTELALLAEVNLMLAAEARHVA